MAIVYSSVILLDNAITLNTQTYVEITLTVPPTGPTWGAIEIHADSEQHFSFPIIRRTDLSYYCKLNGGLIRRCINAQLNIVMSDNGGPVIPPTALTISVTAPSEPYTPAPLSWVKRVLLDNWDISYVLLPTIEFSGRMKRRRQEQLQLHITLSEHKRVRKVRARGDYKDTEYPMDFIIRSQGHKNSEDIAIRGLSEVKRIMELNWNYIGLAEYDYILFDDEGHDLSYAMAGQYEWRWSIRLKGSLRGVAGTPATPIG